MRKAHHVALAPAFALLWLRGLGGRRWVLWFAAFYWLACVAGEALVGKAVKNVQQSLYIVTVGTLLLWAMCLRWTARPGIAGAGVDALDRGLAPPHDRG